MQKKIVNIIVCKIVNKINYSLAIHLDVILEGLIITKITALQIIFNKNYSLAGYPNILKMLRD